MAALISAAIAVLIATGTYLLLRARTFSVIFGLTLISYAVNLFLLAAGHEGLGDPPVLVQPPGTMYSDPLPQALVLTAIVISFGMTSFLVVLALRAYLTLHTDHVDGREPGAPVRDRDREEAGV